MGGLFKNKKPDTTTPDNTIGGFTTDTAPAGAKLSSGGFIDDGAKRMPSVNDAVQKNNLDRIRRSLSGRSGRSSTDLSGTRAYVNNFMGQTR